MRQIGGVVDEAGTARRGRDVTNEARWGTDVANKTSMVRWGGAVHMGCR